MKHPKRIKFEMFGDLLVIDRNRPGSWTCKLYEPIAGGGHSSKPLVRATGTSPTKAASAAVHAASRIYGMHEHYRAEALHDEQMGPVWAAVDD